MISRCFIVLCLLAAFAAIPRRSGAAPSVPSLFKVDTVGTGFDTPTAIAFLPGGRMLVAEKRGRVYSLLNGVKSSSPVWSRENEVLNEHDRGLLGLAVDPSYVTNRYLYFLYTVDPDSNGTDTNNDAFSRLVRYRMSATDSNVVDYSTRTILMGVSWRYGPLSASPSHTIGSLRFGADGSLLVSCGDGASYTQTDAGGLDAGAFGAGANKTDPYEDIGAFRAQSLTSLCGKILRLNPTDGHGYSSNPYWDGNATSIRSRVWAYGLRNPFRFCIRPGTGSSNPADGDPGTAFIGDVGYNTWEDQNVVRTPGANFGWPCYEGLGSQSSYQGASPDHNGCGSMGQSDNPRSQTAPDAWWNHSTASSSVPAGLKGNAAIGGVFYTGTRYPAAYRGAYFFADYGQDWIQTAVYNAADQLVSISTFGSDMDGPVDFATDRSTGDVYYVAIASGQVRRIRYAGVVPNEPPVAVGSATPSVGVAPFTASFSSAGSSDPDNDPLGYAWDFGDGGSATGPSSSHTYVTPGSLSAVLTVTDGRGGSARDTIPIFALASSDFPTTPVVDRFDRPDGAIGGAWTADVAVLRIVSQALTQQPGAATTVWNGATFAANQEAYVTLNAVTATAPEHDLMLKIQGVSPYNGHVEVRYDAPLAHVAVGTYHPATGWQTHGVIAPVSFGAGDQFGARAFADGTVQVFKNGVLIGTQSVAAWPFAAQGGRIGLTLDGATASRLDDFGGGNVTLTVNTPPTAIMLAPPDGGVYAEGDTIWLHGSGTDAQDTADQLAYRWQMDMHHNNHVHPSSFVSDLRDDYMIGENHDDGTGVFMRILLIVTDRGGKKDTATVSMYPEINLRPAELVSVPSLLHAGLPAEFSFALENTGRMPSPQVHWMLHTNEGLIAEGDTLVPALDRVVVTRTRSAPSAGPHTLSVVVDSAAAIVETDEADNHVQRSVVVEAAVLAAGDEPAVLSLSAARPNPTTSATHLQLDLPAATTVDFDVFDLQGRRVWGAPSRRLAAGRWDLTWPGSGPARPGMYLAVVNAGERSFLRRIVRVR
jgi:glucose/arabinose dehydrogenase